MVYRQNRPNFAFHAKQMSGEAVSAAPAEALWREMNSISGENGYYYLDALWKARGCIDELTGGSGLRRGRRDPHEIAVGDAIDFWRAVAVETKLPGSAALELELRPEADGHTRIVATALTMLRRRPTTTFFDHAWHPYEKHSA
jgi:hypothetical protein